MWKPNIKFASEPLTKGEEVFGIYGKKFFELSNHLGNVMSTITDIRFNDGGTYKPAISRANDYYAFGGQMPGRSLSAGYRYGFNGKENDNEVKGQGNQQDFSPFFIVF